MQLHTTFRRPIRTGLLHLYIYIYTLTVVIPAAVFQRAALALAVVGEVSGPVLSGAVGQVSRYGTGDAGTTRGGKLRARVGQREEGRLQGRLLRFP